MKIVWDWVGDIHANQCSNSWLCLQVSLFVVLSGDFRDLMGQCIYLRSAARPIRYTKGAVTRVRSDTNGFNIGTFPVSQKAIDATEMAAIKALENFNNECNGTVAIDFLNVIFHFLFSAQSTFET